MLDRNDSIFWDRYYESQFEEAPEPQDDMDAYKRRRDEEELRQAQSHE